jgi:hypothetical protein
MALLFAFFLFFFVALVGFHLEPIPTCLGLKSFTVVEIALYCQCLQE